MFTFILAAALVAAGSTDPAPPTTNTLPALPTTTTVAAPVDPLFPLSVGANGPAVAAVQARLGVTVDCDFGEQTAQAVNAWQTERTELAETSQIAPADWVGLAVPITWGTDANSNGSIEPSEVTLVCDGNVELPDPPVDTTGWPESQLATLAEFCGISSAAPTGESSAQYNPDDDSITYSAINFDGDALEDKTSLSYKLGCGISVMPDHVISRLSTTRALDGMQEATFDLGMGSFAAFWNYHPDNGLNLTIYSV